MGFLRVNIGRWRDGRENQFFDFSVWKRIDFSKIKMQLCAADRLSTTLFFHLRFPQTGNWKMTKAGYFPPLFFSSFTLPKI